MSKKANKSIIGAFVVGAVVLVVTGVMIFGSGKFLSSSERWVLYFDGSIQGLKVGAPVVFRGVRIGSVSEIKLIASTNDFFIKIPVFADIDPNKYKIIVKDVSELRRKEAVKLLIERGLKAQLKMQSLVTGQLMVALDFHPDKPIKLVGDGTVQEIPTIQSTFDEFAESMDKLPIEKIFDDMLSAVEGIEKVVNSPEIMKTIKSLNKAVENFDKLVRNIDDRTDFLTTGINETVKETHRLVRRIDGEVEPLIFSIKKTADTTTNTVIQAKKTFVSAENIMSEDSEVICGLINALEELTDAAHSLRILADYLERHPEALLRGKAAPGGK